MYGRKLVERTNLLSIPVILCVNPSKTDRNGYEYDLIFCSVEVFDKTSDWLIIG